MLQEKKSRSPAIVRSAPVAETLDPNLGGPGGALDYRGTLSGDIAFLVGTADRFMPRTRLVWVPWGALSLSSLTKSLSFA